MITLEDFLKTLEKETEVGLYDLNGKKGKFSEFPMRNKYRKVKNLTFYELKDLLHKEVYAINLSDNNGVLVRLQEPKKGE